MFSLTFDPYYVLWSTYWIIKETGAHFEKNIKQIEVKKKSKDGFLVPASEVCFLKN